MTKEKVLDYANKISRTKRGTKDEVTPEHPEYRILEPVVSDEMAEAGLCLGLREPKSAAEVAALSGKGVEETERLLWELALTGAAFVNKIDGVDKYWHDIWVPGHMEMMVNNRENVRRFPVIAECFDLYGKRRGPKGAGMFPPGLGPMRVIPIARSIDGSSRRASYEEVSRYLRESEVFSVSDCSCRTSREVMGEGCGHLKEDMCIQLGHAAEYYIRTGRGRAITREEAFAIIERAEENGLMHSIPNTDGPGKTHAICNCCGCGCFAMRLANAWTNPDMVRSNYVSRVDKDKCVACGECVENCPTNALRLGRKLCEKTPVRERKRELPRDTEWGPEKWNVEYRTNRKVVADSGSSPCKAECPAHIGIQGYIKLASQGKYREALELIKRENPFPAVCGRVCPRKCESACTRGEIDDPVAIDAIKKFVAEQDLRADRRYVPPIRHRYGKKIAVVGAGPSGLSCAYFLAQDGYRVTVFEKRARLGGMLTLGIPAFRLGSEIVEAEIEVIRELGVEFRTGIEVGRDVTLDALRAEGYEAFYLAIGAQAGRKLGIEGESSGGALSDGGALSAGGALTEGVLTGVDFLRELRLGEATPLRGAAIVIGGGNVAIDVARSATRVGAESVAMYCLESRETMPALAEEVEEALAEGIGIENSWGPKRIVLANGRVVGVEFRKCVSVFGADGRFAPSFDETVVKTVPADQVLVSVGQAIDWGGILSGSAIALKPNGTVVADAVTLQTGDPDVFSGGDALTGPRYAIDAIAQGKEAAISIHRYVQKGQSLTLGRLMRDYRALDKAKLDLKGHERAPRQEAARVEAKNASASFADTRGTLTEEQLRKETERCLGCGATVADEFMCVGCGACTLKCKFDAITLVRKYDREGKELRDIKPAVVKYVIARKLRIAFMKPLRALASLARKRENHA